MFILKLLNALAVKRDLWNFLKKNVVQYINSKLNAEKQIVGWHNSMRFHKALK